MQIIYLSYKKEDEAIAKALKDLLKSYNYIVKIDEDKFFSDWRIEMMQSLRESNVVVPTIFPGKPGKIALRGIMRIVSFLR